MFKYKIAKTHTHTHTNMVCLLRQHLNDHKGTIGDQGESLGTLVSR